MAPNEDGRYTLVVAHRDPGVANWLDTGGLHELYALHRWQGLPVTERTEAPHVESRVVKLQELESMLPAGVKRTTAGEREQQLDRRRSAFQRRFRDH